jgi:Adenylylsulphate kinase
VAAGWSRLRYADTPPPRSFWLTASVSQSEAKRCASRALNVHGNAAVGRWPSDVRPTRPPATRGLPYEGAASLYSVVRLAERGMHTYALDGDNLRRGLNRDLGFTDFDRVDRQTARIVASFSQPPLSRTTLVLGAGLVEVDLRKFRRQRVAPGLNPFW